MHKRVGEKSIASNGQQMEIIKYTNADDINVKFEDGTIVEHKSYHNFKKGKIGNPNKKYCGLFKDRTGETIKARNGQMMTIIKYPNNQNMTVQFDDGTIVEHCVYGNFKRGLIQNPNNIYTDNIKKEYKKFYERQRFQDNITKEWYTVILYKNHNDVTVKFDSGEIREHLVMSKVRRGIVNYIPHEQSAKKFRKTVTDKLASKRIGETNFNSIGLKMTIIAYEDAHNMDIQFEDGTIVKDVQYSQFKAGFIRHPKMSPLLGSEKYKEKRIGEETTNNIGVKMKIIDYRTYDDLDVEFEDGVIVKNCYYSRFKSGNLIHPYKRKHYGEVYTDDKGTSLKIIKCLKYNRFDIQFEDGTIMEDIGLPSIKSKTIFKKYYKRKK